ncbi:phage major capsid protein [Carnobacterium viridans]|uniref:Phage major capsid protein, HK97 family n=1 Tax=Carnobacterium viridans TaxID=174587 RepID=A0A1H0YUN0_9LACT|nr:phage major capsid protein [Carnobacterium viridans]UDE94936.1 phage major capsid protein [Carnobacterium viridans]SDQ18902.1 phage major capsid protein, HK97 family [Carnobacterium viridans]
MTIELKDKKSKTLQLATQAMYAALNMDDEVKQKEAFENYSVALADTMKASVQEEVALFENGRADESIMGKRAKRFQLTSKEKKFFAEAVEKQKVDGLDETFPTTIIETLMEDISQEHPLLSQIDNQYTEAVIKYIYSDPSEQTAYWDVIPADIRQILIGAFKTLDLQASKLSGFIALPKGYFKLGPAWLAQYVTTFLREVMTATLEEGVVNGDGKLKPIGMMRKLSGAVDGVYPAKETVSITELTPKSLGGPRALLAKEKMINGQISMVVNPVTYETKVSPNLFFQNTQTGAWTKLPLPNGENVVQSYAVPEGKAVLGNLKNYLLAVAGDLELELYKETLAIEDMDLYIAKMFAAGVAKNSNAFIVLDLSSITGVTVPATEADAVLVKQDTINPIVVVEDPEV